MTDDAEAAKPKPVHWIASSRKDLRQFPKRVRSTFGQALFDAQTGQKHPGAKPLKGFGGAGVLEVVEDDSGSTYRAVYTVRFAGIIYVLHAIQKKSKTGRKTPVAVLDTVRARLKEAGKHYAQWAEQHKPAGAEPRSEADPR
jgi:phage-related protein